MKKFYFIALFTLIALCGHAQHTLGGIKANFGVDADLKASYRKYGTAPGAALSDDWFTYSPAIGKGVIDITGWQYYRSQLMIGKNISFSRGMSVPIFTVVDGRMWLDAIYVRDYTKGGNTKDTTAFNAGKVAQNPTQWSGGPKSTDANSDIVDAYAHLRRDGATLQDSLWLFAGVTTIGNGNSRYADIELYKKELTFNKANGNFTSSGLQEGHTEWLFDPLGNVIQAGDILVTVRYTNSNKPLVDVHIWISKTTRLLTNPSKFKFGSVMHTHGNKNYGYINVLPKLNTTLTGSVIVNKASSGNSDSTYSTPWGTMNSYNQWDNQYDSKQFAEIGLNLTRYGLDVSTYMLTQPSSCGTMFSSVLFKAGIYEDDDQWLRESEVGAKDDDDDDGDGNECYDNIDKMHLRDFAGPFTLQPPVIDFFVTADTINCKKPIGKVKLTPITPHGIYSWSTVDGTIVNQDSDNRGVNVNKKGWYTVNARMAPGCPVSKVEYVYVQEDLYKPIAQASIEWTDMGEPKLVGGDTTLSNVMTPFGKSKGLEWKWTGPDGFVATQQTLVVPWEYAWGSFELSVKEKRNGCADITSVEFAFRNPTNTTPVRNTPAGSGKTSMWYTGNALRIDSDQAKEGSGTIIVCNANGQSLMTKAVKFTKGTNRLQVPMERSNQLRIVMLLINGKLAQTQKIVL